MGQLMCGDTVQTFLIIWLSLQSSITKFSVFMEVLVLQSIHSMKLDQSIENRRFLMTALCAT